MNLKPNTWLTLEETKEWLKIKATDTSYDNIITRLINTACARVENHIDGPVFTREFTEWRDGNSSNVIVPTHRPIVEIVEIKIDYNRSFSTAQALPAENTIIRGQPSLKQVTNDVEIRIDGTDIVLRDDNNVNILGRIFLGSTLQSIQVKYKAGWGETIDDLPDDLVHATLMLVEYLYILRENRELNIKSKGTNGQNYTRDIGIPKEIKELLEDFIDYNFAVANVPQKNTFGI